MELQGTFSSPVSEYMQVVIDYCDQQSLSEKYPGTNRTCVDLTTASSIAGKTQVRVAMVTQNFDTTSFDEPIKN